MHRRLLPLLLGALALAGVVAVAALLLTPPTPQPPNPPTTPPPRNPLSPDVLAKLKAATVFLEIDGGKGGSGSGWFGGGPGLIVTNAHVLNMKQPGARPPAGVSVFLTDGRRFDTPKVRVLATDRETDLAVLEVINETNLPEPLALAPTAGLRELDPLVVFGFPGGRRPAERNGNSGPPAVSATTAIVSAFHRDDAGKLRSVQVQGGIIHGSSGGPVCDPDGTVVGVAARVDTDHFDRLTNLAEAIPGEAVQGLIGGRATELEVGQGYVSGRKVIYPITVRCADPLNRLKAVGVAAWAGEKLHPPSDFHTPATGDVDYSEQELRYDPATKSAGGEVSFPTDANGRTRWLRAYYSNPLAAKRYAAAVSLSAAPPPVAREKVRFGTEAATHTLTVTLESESTERQGTGWERHAVGQEGRFTETAEGAITLEALTLRSGTASAPNAIPLEVADARAALVVWSATVSGRVVSPSPAAAGPKKPLVDRLATQMSEAVAESLVMRPDKELNAGDSWTETVTRRMVLRSEHLLSGPDAPTVQEERTWTYLGRRERAGRAEAVLKLDGVLKTGDGVKCGAVNGRAVVDVRSGRVRDASWKRTIEVEAGGSRWAGSEVVGVKRER